MHVATALILSGPLAPYALLIEIRRVQLEIERLAVLPGSADPRGPDRN